MPDPEAVLTPPDPNQLIPDSVMQAVLSAIEGHVIHLVPLQQDTEESVCITCDLHGWRCANFDTRRISATGIDRDAAEKMLAVQMRADNGQPFLDMEEFRHGLLWLAISLALFHHPEWTPWDGDQRYMRVSWLQPTPGTWFRSTDLEDELPP